MSMNKFILLFCLLFFAVSPNELKIESNCGEKHPPGSKTDCIATDSSESGRCCFLKMTVLGTDVAACSFLNEKAEWQNNMEIFKAMGENVTYDCSTARLKFTFWLIISIKILLF